MPGLEPDQQGQLGKAAAQFNEVDRQHPYSVWARRAMLMSAFCSYQANKYDDAVSTADQYISLHPGSQEVAYAFYLKAISLYEQIVDVGRDQSKTEGALVALQDVVQRFPDTEYARDATLKIDLTQDHLAGKEMEVGPLLPRPRRQYRRHQPLPRGGGPVPDHAADRRGAGAADRGLLFPGAGQRGPDRRRRAGRQLSRPVWYQDAYNILKGRNLTAGMEDKRSWISRLSTAILVRILRNGR